MDTPILTMPTAVSLHPKEDIQVVGANLTQLDQDFSLIIDVLNLSETVAEQVVFQVKFSDSFGKYLFDGTEFRFVGSDAEALPNRIYFFPPFVLDERFRTARQVEIRIESVDYRGGTHVNYEKQEETSYVLPIIPMEKQEKMQDIFGDDVITYGENMVTAWRCICGATNSREDDDCRNCDRNKNLVLNQMTEPFMNLKILSELEEDEDGKVDLTFTQTQLTKAPETTQVIQEKRKNPGDEKKSFLSRLPTSPLTYVLIGIIIISLMVGSYALLEFGREQKEYRRTLKQADELKEAGEYEEAVRLYRKLNTEKPSEEISGKIEETGLLAESKEAYLAGEESLESGNYIPALHSFQQVLPDDEHYYKAAQDEIAALEVKIIGRSKKLIEKGHQKEALSLLDSYLTAVPESAEAMNLKKSILNPEQIGEKDAREIEEARSREEREEELQGNGGKDRSDMAELASNLLHSYQTIVTYEANLRDGPSLDSKILGVLAKGSDVYVYDTLIEGTERVWCHVEVINPEGTITEGWVSSRVIERAKNQQER